MHPGITFSMNFAEWQAAIAAGATLTELLAWDRGDDVFPTWYKAKVLAWYDLSRAVAMHSQDASTPKPKRR